MPNLKDILKEPPDGDHPTETGLANAQRPRLRLVVVNENLLNTFLLDKPGDLTIGRAPDVDILVSHPSISRHHAVLHVGEELTLTDSNSANGTTVNNLRLAPSRPAAIVPGDAIRVGSVLMVLQNEWEDARAVAADATAKLMAGKPDRAAGTSLDHGLAGKAVVVRSEAMRRVFALVSKVAKTNMGVLILGETGVGKEIVAESIHARSTRRAGPFVSLNCAALAESLLESELFGHERGAFTGATESKEGLLEKARGGTVFLDEIGDMSLAVQAKLLRVLEDRKVLRLGSTEARPIDVRFVAATNRNLGEEVAAGRFRKDFYFRLSGVTIQIPPLRERTAEIEPLAKLFLQGLASDSAPGSPRAPELSSEALDVLLRYEWPGNVRELKNVIERAALVCEAGVIRPEHVSLEGLDTFPATPPAGEVNLAATTVFKAGSLRDDVLAAERKRIVEALEKCGGNQTRAAEMLEMPRRTFVRKVAQHGLQKRTRPGE